MTTRRLTDTIAAVATPPGEGGVGIVRVSGPDALRYAALLFHKSGSTPDQPGALLSQRVHYGRIVDPESREMLDDGLLLVFQAPRSYTGEDVIELQCHGGSLILARVLHAVLCAGARHAEPGEFTQRAFLNGRMDLSQAEAVCDLIRARTDAQHRLAIRQRQGDLSRRVGSLRDDVVGALAAVEVTIDFSDEVGDLDYAALETRLVDLERELEALIRMGDGGRIFREGIRLAIVGRPNVGKSSLLNALLREERAIVTPIAGTTRDTIEETASIRGIPITLIDTAGLRETLDEVERIGVERARAAAGESSLALLVADAAAGWTPSDSAILREIQGSPALGVLNKVDAVPPEDAARLCAELEQSTGLRWISVSALTGDGVQGLEDAVAEFVTGGEVHTESVIVTNARHIHALSQALAAIRMAGETTRQGLPPDFISIDLRGALDSLGQITGETASDEIIHRIFHDFCVGK